MRLRSYNQCLPAIQLFIHFIFRSWYSIIMLKVLRKFNFEIFVCEPRRFDEYVQFVRCIWREWRSICDLRLAFWDEDVLVHFFERMPQWFIATFIACLLTTTGSHSYKHQKHLGYLFSLLARWEKYGDWWRTSYFWNTLKCLSFCLLWHSI